MEQLSAELRQTRELVESIEGRDLRRGFTLTLLLLLGAAWLVSLAPLALHRAPDQPADSAAHRGPHRLCRRRLVATARHGPRAGEPRARRSRARRRRVQPHGRSAAAEPRAARVSHADGELAVAGAQDRARAEELADADSTDGRGDAGAAAGRPRLHRSGRRRSSSARSTRSSGACARSRSSPASRRSTPEALDVNALVTERVALQRPAHPETTFQLQARRPPSACARGQATS